MRFTPFHILTAAITSAMIDLIPGAFNPPPRDPDSASEVPIATPKRIEQYAIVGGTDSEIADRFGIDENWLREKHGDLLRRSRGLHALSIRVAQFDTATKKNNATLLTWLGRNILGQSNNPGKPGLEEPHEE